MPVVPSVLVLHGVNYRNTGDMALMETMIVRLREELGPARIVSEDVFSDNSSRLRLELDRLDIETMPALLPMRDGRSGTRGRWVLRLILGAASVLLVRFAGAAALRVLPRSTAVPIRALLSTSVVISKPGGHIYSAPDRRIPSPSYLFAIWAATMLRRPTVVYAQSIGPFSTRLGAALAVRTLRRVQLITAREPLTARWLTAIAEGKHSPKIRLTADEAFLVDPPAAVQRLNPRPILAMTVVHWRFPRSADPALAADRYRLALADVARWFVDDHDGEVRLVRWLAGTHREDDENLVQRLAGDIDRVGRVTIVEPQATRDVIRTLGQADLLVASRMHSAILSMVAGTPPVSIEYLPKTSAVASMALGEEWCIPIEEVNDARLVRLVMRAWEERESLRRRLGEVVPELRERARQNARLVAELVGVQ